MQQIPHLPLTSTWRTQEFIAALHILAVRFQLHPLTDCSVTHGQSDNLCRGAAWQPLAVTEAYMGLDPQVFNSEVRRRALEWRLQQEEDFRTKSSASIKERVQVETQAYLTRMGIMDTKNPVLKNLKVGTQNRCWVNNPLYRANRVLYFAHFDKH